MGIQWVQSHAIVYNDKVADLLAKKDCDLLAPNSPELWASEIQPQHKVKANAVKRIFQTQVGTLRNTIICVCGSRDL